VNESREDSERENAFMQIIEIYTLCGAGISIVLSSALLKTFLYFGAGSVGLSFEKKVQSTNKKTRKKKRKKGRDVGVF
jgi:hypothetical protein